MVTAFRSQGRCRTASWLSSALHLPIIALCISPLTYGSPRWQMTIPDQEANSDPAASETGSPERQEESRTATVDLRNVSRKFGDVAALTDLDLQAYSGAITVLLGPNGAGKTTAIRMITGALKPDSGSVRVFGLDPEEHGEEVRLRCGVVSAKPALYDRLSGWDNLRYAAELYGLGRKVDDRILECAERFGIEGALDQQVGGYSTGMKTRLALSRSILHQPDLLLYDEPTSGLDPESAYAVLDLIRNMTSDGRTVVMCTHLLAEAEGLADRIIVLEHGTSPLAGTHEELARRYWPEAMVRIALADPEKGEVLKSAPGVLRVDGRELLEIGLDDPGRVPELVELLVSTGARVKAVIPHQPTLEDVYFAVRQERRNMAAAELGEEGSK